MSTSHHRAQIRIDRVDAKRSYSVTIVSKFNGHSRHCVFHGRRSFTRIPARSFSVQVFLDILGFIAAALTGASHFTFLPDIGASQNEAMRTIFLVARNSYIARDVRRAMLRREGHSTGAEAARVVEEWILRFSCQKQAQGKVESMGHLTVIRFSLVYTAVIAYHDSCD